MFEITPDTRLGKVAILLALSDDAEEEKIKELIHQEQNLKIAVTYVTGIVHKINPTYAKLLLNAALSSGVIQKKSGHVHALIHASLEAFESLKPSTSVANSIKLKVAVVSDGRWLVVCAYGLSAFSQYTNHERIGMGTMHL